MDKLRLRSNTFVTLLLRAGRPELGVRPEWGENNGGITRSGLLADLLRLSMPSYQPKRMETLVSYFSGFIRGNPRSSPMYLPFSTAACRNGLTDRIQKEYGNVLSEMNTICRNYLDLDDYKLRLLVGGIIDTMLADETFRGRFDTGSKWIEKEGLTAEDHFTLQPFLVSVWAAILADYPDTSQGADTYDAWTEDAGFNTAREITTVVGVERAKKITVSVELPGEAEQDTVEEAVLKGAATDQEERKQQTLISHNGRIYNQSAEKIVNIEHVETLYI